MSYLRFTPYLYLAIAIFAAYDGFTKWNTTKEIPWMNVFFIAMAVFMYFFRRNFAKKFENQNQKQ